MQKTILITGSTDGIGLLTAEMLASKGHRVLLHGRSLAKLEAAENEVSRASSADQIETYLADLSLLSDVEALAKTVAEKHEKLDVLINNAGVFSVSDPVTPDGLDVRFIVNTMAPYLLTQRLLTQLGTSARVVNLSSAAQSSVNLNALVGKGPQLSDNQAYAQSKLALTMWSRHLAQSLNGSGPSIIAVNPGSMLATKMVKEAYGADGSDINVGADILVRAALGDEFEAASGKYFDNDSRRFASPHPDALDAQKCGLLVKAINQFLAAP